MGLAEKRAIKEFQDNSYPGLKKDIDEAAKFEVALDVQWETLAAEGYAHMLGEAIPKVFFKPVIKAFKSICEDDMGKEALQGALKKVVFCSSGSTNISFGAGELRVDNGPVTNVDYWEERRDKIVKLIEAAL